MLRLVTILFILSFRITLFGQCEKLVWSDEFDGPSIDNTKWTFETGNGQGGWGTGQLDYCTTRPENVRIENGVLVQEIRKENYVNYQYTSARMITYKKFDFTYGRVEARIKGLYSQGLGFAFWMLGSSYESVPWPKCGEIDIFELTGKTPAFNIGTAHFQESWGHQWNQGQYSLSNGTFADDFHIIGIEWSPKYIKWYIDGNVYHTFDISNKINGYDPFNRPFFIILSSGVGGSYSGNPDETTVFPMETEIDWVRVYQGSYNYEIKGSKDVIQNTANVKYTISPADTGLTYTWNVPAGAEIVSDQGTGSIYVNWGTSGGAVSVEITSACNSNTYSIPVSVVDPSTVSIAKNKPAYASSSESNLLMPEMVNDGDEGTRWSSAHSNPQWIYIDLLSRYNISKVVLKWETPSAKAFQVQVSDDHNTWQTVVTENSGTGGTQTFNLSNAIGKYIRVYGTQRNTQYGYSLYEIEVYGSEVASVPKPNKNAGSELVILPSGGRNEFTIPNTSGSITNIKVFSSVRRLINVQQSNTDYHINLSACTPGIYIIRGEKNGYSLVRKISNF